MLTSYIGEFASLGAALIWACSISLYRHFGRHVVPEFINLFKCTVASTCLILTILVTQPAFPTDPAIWTTLCFSGLIGLALGDTAFFTSLVMIGAQMSSALQTLSPAFAAIIAFVWLGESLTLVEMVGMTITMFSLIAAVHFSQRHQSKLAVASPRTLVIGIVFGVLSAFLQAVGLVLSRAALQHVDVVYGSLMRMLPTVAVLLVWFVYRRRRGQRQLQINNAALSRLQWVMLTLAAFSGSFVGIILGSAGAKYTKAAISSVLTSTYPIWIVPIAWMFLDERSNWQTVMCIFTAVVGVALMFF